MDSFKITLHTIIQKDLLWGCFSNTGSFQNKSTLKFSGNHNSLWSLMNWRAEDRRRERRKGSERERGVLSLGLHSFSPGALADGGVAISLVRSWGEWGSERSVTFPGPLSWQMGGQDRNPIGVSKGLLRLLAIPLNHRASKLWPGIKSVFCCLLLKIKVYCNTATLTCLHAASACFSFTPAEWMESLWWDCMVHKPKIFTVLAFEEKVGQPTLYGVAVSLKHQILNLTHASLSPGCWK